MKRNRINEFNFTGKNMFHSIIDISKFPLGVKVNGGLFRVYSTFDQQFKGWPQQPCDPERKTPGSEDGWI